MSTKSFKTRGEGFAPPCIDKMGVDGVPFSILMKQAVALKVARSAPSRSIYDRYPKFFQSTLFPCDDVREARACCDFESKLNAALRLRECGNTFFHQSNFRDALNLYEKSCAVFKYLESTNPDWRNEDIRDEMLKEIKYEAENERDAASLKTFFLKSYANIALANLKLNQFQEAENACNEMLHIDPFNTKGLYLRSQTRLRPKSSSFEEKEKGCKDLWLANKYNPQNSFIRKLLGDTLKAIKGENEDLKRKYWGVFDRGSDHMGYNLSTVPHRSTAAKDMTKGNKSEKITITSQQQTIDGASDKYSGDSLNQCGILSTLISNHTFVQNMLVILLCRLLILVTFGL